MFLFRSLGFASVLAVVVMLTACQSPSVQRGAIGVAPSEIEMSVQQIGLDVHQAWGGAARCSVTGCQLVAIEHESSNIVLYQFEGRSARLLDRQSLAYHPDSAVWLTDDLIVAAVEASQSLDFFGVKAGKLEKKHQIAMGFAPRDVLVVSAKGGRYQLLVTPYSGKEVAWVDYTPNDPASSKVTKRTWCEAPWHPTHLSRAPNTPLGGIAVGCLDERRIVFVPQVDLFEKPSTLAITHTEQNVVPRQVRTSPSGRWLYAALEIGGRNMRVDMDSGEKQWINSPLVGAVSVLPISDDLVIWGEDMRLYLQRLDQQGNVLETRWLPADGFATLLQLQDLDEDGESDLIVYNSTALPKKMGINVIYGPLWENSKIQKIENYYVK